MELMQSYFSGKLLYGDNFTKEQIQRWYKDEEEGYADLVKDKKSEYIYPYHKMNIIYGFDYLKKINHFHNVLGIGAAFGHEFLPILPRINNLTIVEPSEYLRSDRLGHLIPTYVKPTLEGYLDFPNNSFDLITCFSALHHIPNVNFVLCELVRVLEPGGILLIREPIRTMGDWRKPRRGLTKNERGIPHLYFDNFFEKHQLHIIKKSFCDSNYAYRILSKLIKLKRDSIGYQKFDRIISQVLKWNIHYHPLNNFQKISPASVFYVVKKNN